MRVKCFGVFLLLVLLTEYSFSQNQVVYTFRVFKQYLSDSIKSGYYGRDFEFESKRVFLPDSSFFDDPQFTRKEILIHD
ncbi:MAG: hypothetical protein IPJ60_10450 [Sphingobacteriaceae bacterium]|nr:hypothetical protein [Sphingobacteriaceae bacterium]